MYNPNDKHDRGLIRRSIKHYWRTLSPFRNTREKLVKDYAGSHYSDEKPDMEQIVNLLLQTAETYTSALAGARPRALISTHKKELGGFKTHWQSAINNLIVEIHLEDTFNQLVMDAFFGPGICKTHHPRGTLVEAEADVWMDPGMPFCERISLDRYVHDTGATDYRKCEIIGNTYRVPYDWFRDNDDFNQKVIKKYNIKPDSKHRHDGQKAEYIGQGHETDEDEVQPMITLGDYYLREPNLVVTWPTSEEMEIYECPPVADFDHVGPEEGPYSMLNLGPVPDNVMPTSPAANLKYLSDLVNSLARKDATNANEAKTIHAFDGSEAAAAERAKRAGNGEFVKFGNVEAVKSIVVAELNPAISAARMAFTDLYDRMGGNVKAKAGLGVSAPTATQEGWQRGEIAELETNMQSKVHKFAAARISDLGNLMWEDEVLEIANEIQPPGAMRTYNSDWTPEFRMGRFTDYNFDIEQGSMRYKTPGERASTLMGSVSQFAPMMPMFEQRGVFFRPDKFIDNLAELLDEPRLKEVFEFDAPSEPQ